MKITNDPSYGPSGCEFSDLDYEGRPCILEVQAPEGGPASLPGHGRRHYYVLPARPTGDFTVANEADFEQFEAAYNAIRYNSNNLFVMDRDIAKQVAFPWSCLTT